MASTWQHTVTMDNLNPCIKTMEYAVRGPLVIRATEIEKELQSGVKKPFDSVIKANIGEPSYEEFNAQKSGILNALADRAKLVADTFNSMEGFTCQIVQGAMYAFPRLHLPAKAIAKAKEMGQAPDVLYAFQLLENTGICIIPGSGFGQRPGSYHFRTTILPQKDALVSMLGRMKIFHENFIKEYSD